MHPLHDDLRFALSSRRDERDRQKLLTAFPALKGSPEQHYLALRRYLNARPERFFSRHCFHAYLDWLQTRHTTDSGRLSLYIAEHRAEIDRALLHLREINTAEWHDKPLESTGDYDLFRAIDKNVHPTYLRLAEGVLTPFLRPLAYFSRIDRAKGTDALDVWAIVEELRGSALAILSRAYKHIIRNGIAHGDITFRLGEIRYRDKKGNEETWPVASVIDCLDDLLDTCNAVAAALKVFLVGMRGHRYPALREILIEELQEESSTPWWTIEGCVEADIGGKSQLTVFARVDTRHSPKVEWCAYRSGFLAEYFAPGYDRYFLSLRTPNAGPAWIAFDGKRLQALRESGVDDLSKYVQASENGLISFDRRFKLPSFLGMIETIRAGLRLNLSGMKEDFRRSFGIPALDCRTVTVHRNSWGAVLNASVIAEGLKRGKVAELVRQHRRRFVRAAISHARQTNRWNIAAYLPVGFAQINVFRADYRCRHLANFGLAEDLICTVRLHRLRRIQAPDILGSTVFQDGNWRIAWNQAWLESSGEKIN